jgi:DNA-binding response OmpR family regulator
MATDHLLNKALIIEDSMPVNQMLRQKLEQASVASDGCFDGQQGLERMRSQVYDFILMDLMMPIKDGFAVLSERAGTQNAQTPIYVLTTLEEEKCELALALGAKRVFIKSRVSPAIVIAEILKDMEPRARVPT